MNQDQPSPFGFEEHDACGCDICAARRLTALGGESAVLEFTDDTPLRLTLVVESNFVSTNPLDPYLLDPRKLAVITGIGEPEPLRSGRERKIGRAHV